MRVLASLKLFFLILFTPYIGEAQETVLIEGSVTETSTQPLPFVNVILKNPQGETISGTITDEFGAFSLSKIPIGNYILEFSFIGYETIQKKITAGGLNPIFDLGKIQMMPSAEALTEVQILAKQAAVSADLAKKSFSLDENLAQAGGSVMDAMKTMPGVDVAKTGINQSNTVTRGFNNVFSGSLLVLTDHRYARLPSLRLNNYNLLPTTSLDIERIEVVLGPAAALYGPNSANGVMHIITTSPIDRPGSTMSLSGGNRGMAQGTFRQAWAFSDKVGLKVSGTYFRGNDFEYTDPVEAAASAMKNLMIPTRHTALLTVALSPMHNDEN